MKIDKKIPGMNLALNSFSIPNGKIHLFNTKAFIDIFRILNNVLSL